LRQFYYSSLIALDKKQYLDIKRDGESRNITKVLDKVVSNLNIISVFLY